MDSTKPKRSPCFTREQVAWAKTHDWFIGGNEYGIIAREDYSVLHDDKTITNHRAVVIIRGFSTLRNWAGY